MNPTIKIALLLSFGVLSSCSTNALYFAETTKFALAIDLKPDASEPVNTTLGYKRRIAAIVPAKQVNPETGRPEGEALSLVSKFDVYPKVPGFGIVISHNFASGQAAVALTAADDETVGDRVAALMEPALQVGQLPAALRLRARCCRRSG